MLCSIELIQTYVLCLCEYRWDIVNILKWKILQISFKSKITAAITTDKKYGKRKTEKKKKEKKLRKEKKKINGKLSKHI